MKDQIKKSLLKFANQDLAIARKNGSMSIVETRLGTIHIDYFSIDRTYSVYYQNGKSLNRVKAKFIKEFLINSYYVVIESLVKQ